jgi:hypothetical protein
VRRGGKKRRAKPLLDADSMMYELPIVGKAPATAAAPPSYPELFDLIPHELLPEIDLGPKSKVYGSKLQEYIKLKKIGLDARGEKRRVSKGEQESRGVQSARGYKLKIETVLAEELWCDCAWDHAGRTWASRCQHCKELQALYLYDRGFTRDYIFARCGVMVMTPGFRARNQLVFDQSYVDQGRAIARERIPVEQSNREMRRYDGFHGTSSHAQLYLMDGEAQCARGLVNLGRRINNWAEASAGGSLSDGESSSDGE